MQKQQVKTFATVIYIAVLGLYTGETLPLVDWTKLGQST